MNGHTRVWHPLFFEWWVRLGKRHFRLFSERYQGVGSIPIRFHYLFGERITFTRSQVGDK